MSWILLLYRKRVYTIKILRKRCLSTLALNNDGDQRSGYYLQQIPGNSGDIESFQISANYGYKRALYKCGYILFKGKNKKNWRK